MAEDDAATGARADNLPSSSDLVRGWLDGAHGTPDGEQLGAAADGCDEVDPQEEEFDEDGIIQEIAEYTRLMVGSDAYRFLLANVRAEASLAQDDTMNKIRETMTSALSPIWRSIRRQRPPDVCKATFAVNWEPFTFLGEQGYTEPPEDAISSAVTVTGSSVDAQATTVAHYLAQTWPDVGLDVLGKIQGLLRGHASVQGASGLDAFSHGTPGRHSVLKKKLRNNRLFAKRHHKIRGQTRTGSNDKACFGGSGDARVNCSSRPSMCMARRRTTLLTLHGPAADGLQRCAR